MAYKRRDSKNSLREAGNAVAKSVNPKRDLLGRKGKSLKTAVKQAKAGARLRTGAVKIYRP